jgi:hypothetical protein
MRLATASRRRRGRDLTRHGDSAAGRDVTGGGEVEKFSVGCGILGWGCGGRRSAMAAVGREDRRSVVVAGVEENCRRCGSGDWVR